MAVGEGDTDSDNCSFRWRSSKSVGIKLNNATRKLSILSSTSHTFSRLRFNSGRELELRPKRFACETVVRQMSRAAGKDLQPERFEQSHAQDVLVFVADGDVVEENSFQLETKPAVKIDIAHVDVARVDVNLV